MLDNKKLTEFVKENLKYLPYEEQVKIWDKNCSSCPFKLLLTVKNKTVRSHESIEDARNVILFDSSGTAKIIRGCQFGGQEFSLTEIITNTCRFWKDELIEGGSENPDNQPDCFVEGDIDEFCNIREARISKTLSQ